MPINLQFQMRRLHSRQVSPPVSGLLIILLLFNLPLRAQDENEPASGAEAGAPTITRDPLSALSLAFANGQVQYLNGVRTATLRLSGDFLPLSPLLQRHISQAPLKPKTYEILIANGEDAVDKKPLIDHIDWKNSDPDAPKALHEFLLPGDNTGADPVWSNSNTVFNRYWLTKGAPGYSRVKTSIHVTQYGSMVRDFLILDTLLRSTGIRSTISLPNEIKGKFQYGNTSVASSATLEKGIKWKVRLIRFPVTVPTVDFGPPDEASRASVYYRCTVTALHDPVKLTLIDSEATEVKLTVNSEFRNGGPGALTLSQLILAPASDQAVSVQAVIPKPLQEIKDESKPSSLETTIRNLTGLGDLAPVVKGWLGGTTNSSIVTGGLIGSGKVGTVIGVNMEGKTRSGVSPGFLFGLDPSDNTNLYAGPSLRSGILMGSIGARIYERQDGSNLRTKLGLGGVISVDLSRLTQQKKDIPDLKLLNSSTDSEWGKASDKIFSTLNTTRYTIVVPAASPDPDKLRILLTRIMDIDGQPEAEPRYSIVLPIVDKQGQLFLTRGTYTASLAGADAAKWKISPPRIEMDSDLPTETLIKLIPITP